MDINKISKTYKNNLLILIEQLYNIILPLYNSKYIKINPKYFEHAKEFFSIIDSNELIEHFIKNVNIKEYRDNDVDFIKDNCNCIFDNLPMENNNILKIILNTDYINKDEIDSIIECFNVNIKLCNKYIELKNN